MDNKTKKTTLQKTLKKLHKAHKAIDDHKKTLTNKDFKREFVFVHHEDDSHFIFEDAFIVDFNIADSDDDKNPFKFKVVFSRGAEPQMFFPRDLFTIQQYGEVVENTWEKTKKYRPKRIQKPAYDYIKKQGVEFEIKDFCPQTLAIVRMPYLYMSLNHAKIVETDDVTYVFTEHNGNYAIKKKDGQVTEIRWKD